MMAVVVVCAAVVKFKYLAVVVVVENAQKSIESLPTAAMWLVDENILCVVGCWLWLGRRVVGVLL